MANIKKYQMRRLTIKGGAVQQLQVQGTDINVLRFINWGQNELRISQNSDPQNYPEVIISGNGGTNNMMDPAGISRVFIYAAADVSIGLVEIQMDDPMLILAMESVVANLLTSLPAGTAHVGSVSVDQGGVPVAAGNPFPVAVKGSLPAGTDIIGKVGMDPANNGVSLTVSTVISTTHHNAATVVADGTDVNVTGLSTVGVQVSGTAATRTVKFLGSIDGVNFFDVQAVSFTTGAVATSTTANDAWQVDVRGLSKFRARLDAVAGGNATVVSKAVA